MKISIVVGSIGSNSYNMKLARFIKNRYRDIDFNILDLKDVPMYSMDDEENPDKIIKDYKEDIKGADGVIIITPEYNYSIPGVLKNFLDWISRGEPVLPGKPTMILGATIGRMGTIRAQDDLLQILRGPTLSPKVLQNNDIYISQIQNIINEDGEIEDEALLSILDKAISSFRELL